MTLPCCSDLFLTRIDSPARRGKRVRIFELPAGPGNPNWFAGAYGAALPQDGEGGRVLRLTDGCKAQLAARCAQFPLVHENRDAFEEWINAEINQISNLVAAESPATSWTSGRSQKIINILLKYCCAAYHSTHDEFAAFRQANPCLVELTPWLHAPVDRATIKHLARSAHAAPEWGTYHQPLSWWRDMTLDKYHAMQTALEQLAVQSGVPRIHYEMIHIW